MSGWVRLRAAVVLCIGLAVGCGSPSEAADTVDQSTDVVGRFDVVARFQPLDPSGIAITPDGSVFIGFPRHADDHKGPTLTRLENGRAVPFPNEAMTMPANGDLEHHLVSVHGMTTDSAGRLWVIDDGKRAGRPLQPGASKVVGFDPKTGEVVGSVVIRPPVLLPDSHLNDLRVDLTHGAKGTAYIADSSFGTSPALIVVDLATGRQRRVLTTHRSTQPEQGFLAILEGKPLRYDPEHPTFPVGGVDGITLSPDSRRLYYSPLTSRRLYSIPTASLADFGTTDAALAAAVVDEGEKGFADGLATDRQGRIYTTNAEHHSILRRWPDGHFDVVVRDPRIVWPDGIFVTDRYVYVTLGQWDRHPSFNEGHDRRQPPYIVMRAPIGPQR